VEPIAIAVAPHRNTWASSVRTHQRGSPMSRASEVPSTFTAHHSHATQARPSFHLNRRHIDGCRVAFHRRGSVNGDAVPCPKRMGRPSAREVQLAHAASVVLDEVTVGWLLPEVVGHSDVGSPWRRPKATSRSMQDTRLDLVLH
jgi:hypothetical protein